MIQNNLNPDFTDFIECDYYFEKEQTIKFMVYDIDNAKGGKDFIGQCITTIGKIFGSNKQTFVGVLSIETKTGKRGNIVIRLDSVSTTNDEVRMKLSSILNPIAFLCCAGVNNPYFVISRARDLLSSG